jgi:serine/threonine protein kinase
MRCFALNENGTRCSKQGGNNFPPLCSSHRSETPMSFNERKTYRQHEANKMTDTIDGHKALAKQATEQALAQAAFQVKIKTPMSDVIQECRVISKFNTYFTVLKNKGEGSFGKVYSARVTTKGKELNYALPDIVAVKEMRFNSNSDIHIESLKNELRILKEINVPHSVKYYGCYIESDKIYIVMELVKGDELSDVFLKVKLNKREKLLICRNIALAIKEIHMLNIAHRDLKLQNIMVDLNTFEIKLIDFGLACNLAEMSLGCNVISGSPSFIDPQMELLNIDSMKLADWWAFGQIMFILFTNKMLYDGGYGGYRPIKTPEVNKIPEGALRTIMMKLTDAKIKQNDRPSPDEIIASLERLK